MSDFYNKYPYTDFHELNLDWVIERVKKLTEDWAATSQEWDDTEAAWNDLHDYVMNYFANLDVQEEINHKLDIMAQDGTLDALLLPYFNAYKADINGIIADQNQTIETLSERVTEIASLPEGSTTGDAELIDIRTPATGFHLNQAYASAGDSVRGQVANLNDRLNKNVIDNISALTGLKPMYMIVGVSYTTNITPAPLTPTSNNLIKSCVFDCQAGDKFIIWGTGASGARLWCFVDSSNNVLENATSGATENGKTLIAPSNTSKLVINILLSSDIGACFKIVNSYNEFDNIVMNGGIQSGSSHSINDVNSQLDNVMYGLGGSLTSAHIANLPLYGYYGVFISKIMFNDNYLGNYFSVQSAYYSNGRSFYRLGSRNQGVLTFSDWFENVDNIYIDDHEVLYGKGSIYVNGAYVFDDADYINNSGVFFIGSSTHVDNMPKYGVACSLANICNTANGIITIIQLAQYMDGTTYIRYNALQNGVIFTLREWAQIEAQTKYVVDINGSGDFDSLVKCIEHINDLNLRNAYVYVKAGTYDIYDEYIDLHGADYFDNITSDYKCGMFIGRGITIEFEPGAKAIFNYTGNNMNVYHGFSIYNCYDNDDMGYTLINNDLEVQNCRYCVHDDHGALGSYTNVYDKCKMSIDNTNNPNFQYSRCIGGGMGLHGTIEIKNCEFTSGGNTSGQKACVTYHNANNANAIGNVYFHDNVCSGGTFIAYSFGPNTELSKCYVSNNILEIAPFEDYAGGSTIYNMKLIAFNNQITS